MEVIARWTVEVCQKCGKVHRGSRSSCIMEFDPAGDTFADVELVEVVPAETVRGAVEDWQTVATMCENVTRIGLGLRFHEAEALLAVARRHLGGQHEA